MAPRKWRRLPRRWPKRVRGDELAVEEIHGVGFRCGRIFVMDGDGVWQVHDRIGIHYRNEDAVARFDRGAVLAEFRHQVRVAFEVAGGDHIRLLGCEGDRNLVTGDGGRVLHEPGHLAGTTQSAGLLHRDDPGMCRSALGDDGNSVDDHVFDYDHVDDRALLDLVSVDLPAERNLHRRAAGDYYFHFVYIAAGHWRLLFFQHFQDHAIRDSRGFQRMQCILRSVEGAGGQVNAADDQLRGGVSVVQVEHRLIGHGHSRDALVARHGGGRRDLIAE